MRHKSELIKENEATLAMLGDNHLMPLPGVFHSVYRNANGDIIPSYMLADRSEAGVPFSMPDFVMHRGLEKGDGFQRFSHDVLHLLANNVEGNLPLIKKCWSELHKKGTPDKRYRDGVLGHAGELEGQTVVLCAPGPSLASSMPAIEKARSEGKVKVVAINRAVRALEADYLVFIERFVPPEWRDEHVHELQRNAKVVLGFQTDAHLASEWPEKDNLYWGYFNFGPFAQDKRVNHLVMMDAMASTTVATALRVVYELGAARVLLAGVDFACETTLVPYRLPLGHEKAEEVYQVLLSLSNDILKGNGKKDDVKRLASYAHEASSERELYGWDGIWRSGNFYWDLPFDKSPYVGDPRFSNWRPVRSVGGKPVLTTMEFLNYAEQMRTVIGVIESSRDCKIFNISAQSVLSWRYVPFDEALK